MKRIKLLYLATLAIAAGIFSACDDKDFQAGPAADGAQVYFSMETQTEYTIGDEESSLTLPVYRVDTDGALSVDILADDPSGIFTIPSSVSFAAGAETTDLVVTFDRTALTDGVDYPLSFLINDEKSTTPYGFTSLSITVTPWPWEYLGVGSYRDNWFNVMWSASTFTEVPVKIYESKSTKGLYMVEDMFGWDFLTEFFGGTQAAIEGAGYVTYTSTNITIDCQDPSKVYIPDQFSGVTDLDSDYGDYTIGTLQYGTLNNGIVTFPTKGLALYYANGTKGYYANTKDMFRLMLPGAVITDYSLGVEYGGMNVSADNLTASCILNFSYGSDVADIKYVLAAGDVTSSAADVAATVADGSAENIYSIEGLVQGAGAASVSVPLETGIYTVVAVPFDASGAAVTDSAASSNFYFPGLGGFEIPECDVEVKLYNVSDFNPALTAYYPDYSYAVFQILGSELKSVKYYFNSAALIDNLDSYGYTAESVVEAYGNELSSTYVDKINTNGYLTSLFSNLSAETSYKMIVTATNSYGKSATVVSEAMTTSAVPYDGELEIGNYTITYGSSFSNTFSLHSAGGSTTEFYAEDLFIENGAQLNATYDSEASTLTLSGTEYGYESYGSVLGSLYDYYDSARTMVYGYLSYATADSYNSDDSEGDDPIVFTVDSTTKQLSALQNYFVCVPVFNYSDGSITSVAGYAFAAFGASATVAKDSETSAAKSAKGFKSVKGLETKVPFSSANRFAASPKKLRNRLESGCKAVAEVNIAQSSNKVATLKVNPTAYTPKREFSRRSVDAKFTGEVLK